MEVTEDRVDLDRSDDQHRPESIKSISSAVGLEVDWIDEEEEASEDRADGGEFERLLRDEGGGLTIREGTIVPGTIVSIEDDLVAIDIGHKCDGSVPIQEFKDSRGELQVKVGDKVEVYLDTFENNDGEMILSRERAEIIRSWDRVSKAFEKDEIVEGTIISRVKGGLAVDIGIKAFLPGSQVDLRPVKNFDHMLGNKFQFKIIKFNKRKNNVVLSRRVLLEQGREKLRSETLQNLKPGLIITGIVKNITDYGVFVDLGGIDGLLHITDMSWGRINHPSQLLEVGEETKVKVLSYNEAKQRVSLGYKQLQPDPWEALEDRYEIDSKVHGKVVSITDYGAFVELEPGVEGLIHVSEMSWSKKIKHPSKCVQIGDDVDVVVLSIDPTARRISLGMKQAEPNPWLALRDKYKVGDTVQGKVRNITEFGLFVGVGEGVDGLVHISDISWSERVNHPGDLYRKGSEIEAKILQIDVEEGKFSLGIKQLQPDPFTQIAEKNPVGSHSTGKVERVSDFGVFIALGSGIEGLIHQTELSDKEFERIADVCQVGDELDFVVLSIDSEERRFSLSRKAWLKKLHGKELKEYIDTAKPKTRMADAFMKVQTQSETAAAAAAENSSKQGEE
ncbi:MAG: 30S ribosomal protein S1 [Pseudomonadota bacterium]|nr:30S ribosomal protein S1 [Pseudomonadota bacterium]